MKYVLTLVTFATVSFSIVNAKDPVKLFDGKDIAKWYTFLREHKVDKDPNGTFTVKDGVLRISGQDFGGLVTRDEYSNYSVEIEYTWGGKVWPGRDKTARDSGFLVHCTGENGVVGGSWLMGYQCNMIEGGTGDISITGSDKKYRFKAEAEERPSGKKAGLFWKEGATAREFAPGQRLFWFDRDPNWENVLGFRGKNDVEKPVKEWNTLIVTMKDDTMAVKLNGVTLTKATGLSVTKGKLQIQSEGSEILFRKIILTPLE
jgi:hypothetical protein